MALWGFKKRLPEAEIQEEMKTAEQRIWEEDESLSQSIFMTHILLLSLNQPMILGHSFLRQ